MSRWWPWGKYIDIYRNIYKPPPFFTKSEADWLWNGDANPWLWKRKEPEVMSVKVEKIEPKTQAKFRATGANGESLSHFDWTESEARAIYLGLAEHFQTATEATWQERAAAKFQYDRAETIRRRNHEQVEEIRKLKADNDNYCTQIRSAWAESGSLKAEVARLRKLATENADLHVRAEAEIVRLKAGLDKCQERNLDHTAENAKLKAQLTAHEGSPCQWYKPMCEAQCEVARLRGWLEWIKESSKHFDPPNGRCESAMDAAWRALAGKKVPE